VKKIRLLALAGLFVLRAAPGGAGTLAENFSTDPAQKGWQVFGNTNLFQWNPTNHALDVTWDSSQTNSYFYHPLGATFTAADSFCVIFDLQLQDAAISQYGNQVAIGLLHFADATSPDFNRANGPFPNVFEFDYFPAFDYNGDSNPDTVDATVKDAQAGYAGFYWLSDSWSLNPTNLYRVVLIHRADESRITGAIYSGGKLLTSFPGINDYGPIDSFQFDTLSINSYSDDGFGDSILAHGSVSRLAFASPLPVGRVNSSSAGQLRFASDTNWLYTLEQSADLQNWSPAAPAVLGNGTTLVMPATNPPADRAFYRIRADLP